MGKVYKKITVEDLKTIEDTWEVNKPMYYTIDIYGSYEQYFQQLVDYLGEIPFDRFERGRYIEEKIQDVEEYEKLLKEVNRFVYNYEGADNEGEYVRNHPEKFVLDGYYDEIE